MLHELRPGKAISSFALPGGQEERLVAGCYDLGCYHRFWRRGALIGTHEAGARPLTHTADAYHPRTPPMRVPYHPRAARLHAARQPARPRRAASRLSL